MHHTLAAAAAADVVVVIVASLSWMQSCPTSPALMKIYVHRILRRLPNIDAKTMTHSSHFNNMLCFTAYYAQRGRCQKAVRNSANNQRSSRRHLITSYKVSLAVRHCVPLLCSHPAPASLAALPFYQQRNAGISTTCFWNISRQRASSGKFALCDTFMD